MDNQILKAKEEAISRKEIMEKVEKWMSACEEENWLEGYNRDENRYNSSRGAHINLKRAEKAPLLVNKIPALVDTLVAKTRAWEEERGIPFIYDGVPLLDMLDEYAMLRHDREEEKQRMRELWCSTSYKCISNTSSKQGTIANKLQVAVWSSEYSKELVGKDPVFVRDGSDIYVDARISFTQAILGGKVEVPTLNGSHQIKDSGSAECAMPGSGCNLAPPAIWKFTCTSSPFSVFTRQIQ